MRHIDYPNARLNARVNETEKIPMPDFFPKIFDKFMSGQLTMLEEAGFEIPDAWRSIREPVSDEILTPSD